jgi:hypothetical protein
LLIFINITQYSCVAASCPNKFITGSGLKVTKHLFAIPNAPIEKRKTWFNTINEHEGTTLNYMSNERKYLCEDHFSDQSFTNTSKDRLNKFAKPTIFLKNNHPQNKINVLQNIILKNPDNSILVSGVPPTDIVHLLIICRYANIRKRPLSPQTRKKSKRGRYSIMKDITCKTTAELTPRKKKKYIFLYKTENPDLQIKKFFD